MTRDPSPLIQDATIRDALTRDQPANVAEALWVDLSDRLGSTEQRRRGYRFSMARGMRLALAAVATLAVIGGSVYLVGPNQEVGAPAPTAHPTVAPTATPEPSAPAQATVRADLTSYTSNRFAYSAEYPASWSVMPAVSDWSSPYPPDRGGGKTQDAFGPQPFGVRVWVTSIPLTTDMDAAARIASFDTENAAFCNKLSDRHSITVGGVTARQEDQLCGQEVNLIQVLAASTDRFYVINFVGYSGISATDRTTFDQFLASFRFRSPGASPAAS